jgi:Na+-transporting NADH:ubiquinone oxidoreductase subunit A
MHVTRIRRGLNVPIHGAPPSTVVLDRLGARRVALLPQEALGIKCRLLVEEGQTVRAGDPLFCDRRDERVMFTAPRGGRVVAVERGARPAVLAVVIEVDAQAGEAPFEGGAPDKLGREELVERLAASGLWPALRQRPFDCVARSTDQPGAIFVTAHDTRPCSVSPRELIRGREAHLQAGLLVLQQLTEGRVFLCTGGNEDWSDCEVPGVQREAFEGPHPAGNAGTHIHTLYPVSNERLAWHVGAQDVADIGQLFLTGKRPSQRVIALGGPAAREPKLLRVTQGADLSEVLEGELAASEPRVLNGSALDGRTAGLGEPSGFLSRYANQVTVLEDQIQRELLGWALPVSGRFTLTNTVLDKFFRRRFNFNTDSNGSLRAIVPIGSYEEVMPLDVLPTQLIKALSAGDVELAEKLGVLELVEEDLALCQFVDPCKVPMTEWLRAMLTSIEKEAQSA